MNTVIGILLSLLFGFVPMLIFAYIIYWLDRYEKEPKLLLGAVFCWGAIVAAGGAFLFNTVLGLSIYIFTGSEVASELSTGSIFAPIIEETLKGFAVLLVFLFFRREFDSIMDGIVYAAVTALGFAATENAYYIYNYGFAENGMSGFYTLVFIRVILVGWQHPFYTSFTGIGLAVARLNRPVAIKIIAPLVGWGVSMFTHALHNTLATIIPGLLGMFTTTILDWSGWFMMFLFILWAVYREQRWIIAQLREEVTSGVISPAQYHTACSAWLQSFSRLGSLFSGKFQVTNRFYKLTAELAFKKQQLMKSGDEGGNTATIEHLRAELTQLSPLTRAN